MTTAVITVDPDTPLKDAAEILAKNEVSGVPVVDARGVVTGVLSAEDIVHRESAGELPSGPVEPKLLATTVVGAMSSPAVTIDPRQPVTDAAPVEPSGGAPSDRLPTFLQEHRRAILTAAGNALARQHMPHYSWDGDEAALRRLSALFERLLCALDSHDLGPIVAYAERVAEERFSAGYDLSEVQVAFNALEETTWSCVLAELDASRFAEAISLIGTAIGAGKDALARKYVSLATGTHVTSLDVRALFGGSVEGIHAGQRRRAPDPARLKEEGER